MKKKKKSAGPRYRQAATVSSLVGHRQYKRFKPKKALTINEDELTMAKLSGTLRSQLTVSIAPHKPTQTEIRQDRINRVIDRTDGWVDNPYDYLKMWDVEITGQALDIPVTLRRVVPVHGIEDLIQEVEQRISWAVKNRLKEFKLSAGTTQRNFDIDISNL